MPPTGALPLELAPIVTKLLETDRAKRYQTASEVRTELDRVKQGTAPVPNVVPPGRTRAKVIAGAAMALVVASGVTYLALRRAPKLSVKGSIVVADFSNTTREPVFDETLRQGLSVQLEQSPALILFGDRQIQSTLGLMGQPKGAKLTPEIAEQLCQRVGSTVVLEGSIASLGGQYILGIRAKNCHTGEVVDDQQVQVGRKEDVLGALTSIASRLRLDAGESAEKVKEYSTPLAAATTPSLDALKAYSTAWKVHNSGDSPGAVVLLKQAIEIDSKFAMAYAFLGQVYSDMNETALSAESLRRAYELRDHASDRERLFIENHYEREVTGNLELAQRSGESWAQAYPRDREPHVGLSFVYQQVGKYERSLEEGNASIELDPDFPPGYMNAAWAYIFLDRLAEAENLLQRAAARKLQGPDLLILPYYIAFLKNDQAGMQRAAEVGKQNSATEDWISDQEAVTLAYSGHLKRARSLSHRAADLAEQHGQRERVAMFEAGSAVREAFFGNTAEARRNAMAALKNSNARDIEYGAAFALALSGELAQSNALAGDLETRFPEDTYVKFTYVPVLRALAALNRRAPSNAIELLEAAAPYDLAIPGSWAGFYGNLYPVYVRGLSYLAAKQVPQAVSEFQKILDHAAIVFSDPVGAVARVQIARALAQSGGKEKARAAYQDFLGQWKDADPDIPILKQATAEFARLQ